MKNQSVWKYLTCTAGMLLLAGTVLAADGKSTVKEFKQALGKVRAAELPAAAASLVAQSPPALKVTNAVNVVKAAIRISAASTLSVVGAVCGVAPEAASAIVAAAIELQPKLKEAIASVAIKAAPAYREEIAKATVSSQSARALANGGGFGVHITPLPPPSSTPTKLRTGDVPRYDGPRDYSKP